MTKRYVLVEGHGEVEAIQNLLARMSQRFDDHVPWAKPLRWPNLHQWQNNHHGGVAAGVEFIRAKGDAASLLLVRDEDDGCPRDIAPAMAARLKELKAPFPISYVLLNPEYEVLFLPCISQMAGKPLDGRPGLRAETTWGGDWEAKRGLKEWLSGQFPKGKAYKPTVDKLLLTRMIDLDVLSLAGVPCFGTLERSLRFLCAPSSPGGVYP